MSKAQATIVADSIAPSGVRLTTMLLTYATMIHQDILTHRTMYKLTTDENERWLEMTANKSTNSNRAKTTKQVIYEVWRDPFVPTKFPRRAASMHSSKGYLTGWRHHLARQLWLKGRYIAILLALTLQAVSVHKQVANRLLMPWTMTTCVVTAIDTWWLHFFELRDHFMAQDEVQDVARMAHAAYMLNTPTQLVEGEWHLPFVTDYQRAKWPLSMMLAHSVSMCARTSYARSHEEMLLRMMPQPFSDDSTLVHESLTFYRTRLHSMVPPHDGPKEHQAEARNDPNHQSGTLVGWDQLRHSAKGTALLDEEASHAMQPS